MSRPSVFFKYTSSYTAMLILENMRLRWSSPVLFNDVAEFRRMPCFDPTVAHAHKLLPEVIIATVFDGAPLDELRLTAPMKRLLDHARNLAAEGLKREALLSRLSAEAPDADDRIESALQQHFEMQDLTKARVLCVTTEPSNDAMWGTYAESHAGCVLGFRHIESLSTPLLEARPVTYSENRPVVGSGLDFLLFGDGAELRARTLDAVCFTKKLVWSYEREWRVMTWRSREQGQHGDYLFYADELESVTLGARASTSTEKKVRTLVSSRYPSANLYRMHVQRGELVRHAIPTPDGDAHPVHRADVHC